MIRIVLFLVVVGLIAVGFGWLADRPGDVIIVWQGMRITISLMTMTFAVLTAMAAIAFLLWILRLIVLSPYMLGRYRNRRRGERAYEAMSSGLIAIGSGDIAAAQKHAAAVNRLAPGEPLALLLAAQSAQLSGDREGAERAFRTMASRDDTKPLGLHGLFIEAHRRNDPAAALAHAEEAARAAPSLGWASRAVMEARVRDGDWAGALRLLEQNLRTLEKSVYRRLRAVLLTAHARALEGTDRERAKTLALEAQKLAPTFAPTAALAGRLLAEDGQHRKASRIIDGAWRANPHPELAQTYAGLRSGDSARDRLKRIEALAKSAPDHVEGALAVARAAIDAQEFAKARAALEPYLAAPTKRIALLMAELERAEHNDEGRAREWLARAVNAAPDPAWTADGHVSDQWLPASPVTGHLDAFEWRVPLTGIAGVAAVIEPELPPPALPAAEPVELEPEEHDEPEATPPVPANDVTAVAPPTLSTPPSPLPSAQATPPKPEPVIPLVHAPDDPGPDIAVDEETEAPEEPKPSGWRRLFG
jgi:HemY protein